MIRKRLRPRTKKNWLAFLLGFFFLSIVYFSKSLTVHDSQPPTQRPLHFIYTIGCGGSSDSSWQLLQSTALDYSFLKVQQRGKITRLVSGCEHDHEKQQKMSASLNKELDTVFLPGAERQNGNTVYVQANRPTSLLHFFQNLKAKKQTPDELRLLLDTVFVVLDPDFIFRKPVPESEVQAVQSRFFVTEAYSLSEPAAYAYQACLEGLSTNSTKCDAIKHMTSFRAYFGGVPYFMVLEDWMSVLEVWIPLIGPVLQRYPGIESDMISWAIAAAAVGMKGKRVSDLFMKTCMSSESSSVEMLDAQVFLHLCQAYYVPETRSPQYQVNPLHELPYIVSRSYPDPKECHFVYVFNKHWLKNSRLLEDCTVPLLIGPPPLASQRPELTTRYAWHHKVSTEAVQAFNDAVLAYREQILNCPPFPPNTNKGLILHEIHRKRYTGGWNHVIEL